jgi:hypothetical protein
MNIHAVAENLRNTITEKETALEKLKDSEHIIKSWLELNITELKHILEDIEVCCQQYDEMNHLLNPDPPVE